MLTLHSNPTLLTWLIRGRYRRIHNCGRSARHSDGPCRGAWNGGSISGRILRDSFRDLGIGLLFAAVFRRNGRLLCGAKTRAGGRCQVRAEPGRAR
jgi:hypothetical protein